MKDIAVGLASLGRGPDTMLVHMSPGEVAGLQSLAKAHGGSLTLNPHTGLPEAGFLSNILPTIIGIGATVLSGGTITPLMAGLGVGGVEAVRTGDIGKGLMAGLGAFGGAGLGGALSSMGASTLPSTVPTETVQSMMAGSPSPISPVNSQILQSAMPRPDISSFAELGLDATQAAPSISEPSAVDTFLNRSQIPLGPTTTNAPILGSQGLGDAWAGVKQLGQPGGFSQFGTELERQYGGKYGAMAAGIGALGALGGFEQPKSMQLPEEKRSDARLSGPIRRPYDPTAPGGYYFTDYGTLRPTYAAQGGEMHSTPQLEDGGFVLTKRAIDGIGEGSNEIGQRRAAAGLGAIPIRGPGTGTSDSIPTTIDGKYPARISNGEAYVPRDQVKKRGGAKKFYTLMRHAEQAARRA